MTLGSACQRLEVSCSQQLEYASFWLGGLGQRICSYRGTKLLLDQVIESYSDRRRLIWVLDLVVEPEAFGSRLCGLEQPPRS